MCDGSLSRSLDKVGHFIVDLNYGTRFLSVRSIKIIDVNSVSQYLNEFHFQYSADLIIIL